MAWVTTSVMLVAISVVSLQSYSFFARSAKTHYTAIAGTLNLLLGSGGLVAFLLFRKGALIASPEYGVLLVQGTAALIWLCALLFGVSIACALIWQVARKAKDEPSHILWVLLFGVAIAAIAVTRIFALNPDDPAAFCIRFYDMWWPPFLLWVAICLSQWLTATIGVRSGMARFLWAVFSVTGIGFIPVHRIMSGFQYGDPATRRIWIVVVTVGTPLFMAFSSWVVIPRVNAEKWLGRGWRLMVALLAGLAGLVDVMLWVRGVDVPGPLRPWSFWAAWIVTLIAIAGLRLYRGSFKMPRLTSRGILGDGMALGATALIGLSAADMSHFIELDPTWDLAGVIIGWIMLLELIAGSPLVDLRGAAVKKLDTAKKFMVKVGSGAQAFAVTGVRGIKGLFTVESAVKLIVRVLAIMLVLIAIAEIPNAGRTIIHPFSILGLPENHDNGKVKSTNARANRTVKARLKGAVAETERVKSNDGAAVSVDKKYLGQEIADRLANTLALVGHELQPDLLVASSSDPKEKETWISALSEESDGIQSALKGSNVGIPGTNTTFPLEFLTAPIQEPIRQLLGVRVIRGSIQVNSVGMNEAQTGRLTIKRRGSGETPASGPDYVLLANSSTGQTWRVEPESSVVSAPDDPAMLASECKNTNADDGQTQIAPQEKELNLADMLAYKIISSDATLVKMGMASSWRAIPPFREGLIAWKNFERTKDYTSLTASICKFRQAINLDSGFALAHYRLGRALTQDGQPGAAVVAFRASLDAYPAFVAGHIALADTLYHFDDYYYVTPPALPVHRPSSPNERRRSLGEAAEHWRRVIQDFGSEASASDQAAAYAGLCYRTEAELEVKEQQPLFYEARRSYYTAFFYCKRAEYLYSKLPRILRADEQVKAARVSALDQIGEILDETSFPEPVSSKAPKSAEKYWSCDVAKGEKKLLLRRRGPYTPYAVKYYSEAKIILPKDWKAQCYFAIDSLALGDRNPMEKLKDDERMHIKLGDTWWGLADGEADPGEAAALYGSALDEYELALKWAPTNIDALNDYAYAFWDWRFRYSEWRLRLPGSQIVGPDLSMARRAEARARKAALLTTAGNRTERTTINSTLLEVLLGEARPDEASEQMKENKIPDHAYFDDVRWDLAEAYLCADVMHKSIQPSTTGPRDLKMKAISLFKTIREHEAVREDQRFTSHPETLDENSPVHVCIWSQETALESAPGLHDPAYELYLGKPDYAGSNPCNSTTVGADIVDRRGHWQADSAKPLLHVWGGGFDREIPLDSQTQYATLPSKERDTWGYYFAQLIKKGSNQAETDDDPEFRQGRVPLSAVYPIRAYVYKERVSCSKNRTTLRFLRIR